MSRTTILAFILLSTSAAAQTPLYYWNLDNSQISDGVAHQLKPDLNKSPSDLNKAMSICNQHRIPSHQMYATIPPSDVLDWQSDWKPDCQIINSLWEKSEAGRLQQEAEKKEKADRDFVHSQAEKN